MGFFILDKTCTYTKRWCKMEDDVIMLRHFRGWGHFDGRCIIIFVFPSLSSVTREHMQAVIIVPTLLLFASLVTLLCLCFLRFCPERRRSRVAAPLTFVSSRTHSRRPNNRGRLQGIDGEGAPYIFHRNSILAFRFKHIDLFLCFLRMSFMSTAPPGINPLEHEELPMSVQQVQQSVAPAAAAMPQTSTEGRHGAFSQVTALPRSFAVEPNNAVTVYRARMDNRDVVLRALKSKPGRDR